MDLNDTLSIDFKETCRNSGLWKMGGGGGGGGAGGG